jgi:hypothetical protein
MTGIRMSIAARTNKTETQALLERREATNQFISPAI